jgi:hypothetical protein
MKIARCLAAAFLPLAPAIVFAQEGVATFKYTIHAQSAAPTGESRVFFSPNAMRIELQMNMGPSGPNAERDRARAQAGGMPSTFKTTMIQKLSEPDKLYTINDERQTYSVMDLAEIRKSSPSDTTYTVKRTGSDRVAGLSCDKALVTSSKGHEMEVCLTNEIAASSSWVAAMDRNSRAGNWMKAANDAGLKGFPIRMRHRFPQKPGEDITMELVSLEKKSVPASMFAIPPGYRGTSASAVNMSPEQEKRMQDALSQMTPEQRKAYEDAMKAQGKKQ